MDDAPPSGTALLQTPTRLSAAKPELLQLGSQNSRRLRDKFEAIYKKYGKDFAGVGDEIDLETGEIVVDNGHLSEMRDEKDVGQGVGKSTRRLLQDPARLLGNGRGISDLNLSTRGREEEEVLSAEDWDEHMDEGLMSDGGEDTMGRRHTVPQGARKRKLSALEHVRDPTRQVAHRAVRQKPTGDSHGDPAWRVPGLTSLAPGSKPLSRSASSSRQAISASPAQRGSLWALPKRRARRKANPLKFSYDVLKSPGITGGPERHEPVSPIIISDSEDNLAPGKRYSHQHSAERARWENRVPRSFRSTPVQSDPKVICLVSPMKHEEARLYQTTNSPRSASGKSPSNKTDPEMLLESFRRQLAPQRQNRKSNNPNEPFRDLGSASLIKSLTPKGGYPSLNKLARDLFFTSSSVPAIGGSYQISDAAENSDNVNHHMDNSGPGTLSESESIWEPEGMLEPESESGSEWEDGPEPRATRSHRSVPSKKQAELATGAGGFSTSMELGRASKELRRASRELARASRELEGSHSDPNKTPKIHPPMVPRGPCKTPFPLPGLPPGKEFAVDLEDDGDVPKYPYRLLIGAALLSSPNRTRTMMQINTWLKEHFAFFRNHTGWQGTIRATMTTKAGITHTGLYEQANAKRGPIWTILPEHLPRFLKGGDAVINTRYRHKPFYSIKPPNSSRKRHQGVPHTSTRQASHQPVSRLIPLPSPTKRIEIADGGSQIDATQRRDAVTPDSSTSKPTAEGPQLNQDVQNWKADVLELSDAESAGEGPDSNKAIQGRHSEAAAEGIRSANNSVGGSEATAEGLRSANNTINESEAGGITGPGDTIPEGAQSNNADAVAVTVVD
ncbi:hypothetical protein GP486_003028 [Trichoglossum hirsutum]|uniref:Fork-head domain-containing protein n=1 Tax=Trichoglossum hirsutum TaxID=265104 RepID=A0A9P8RR66_9PEZI|nr:hypothetical protein GP486_003028 [Trichoglossum hirsutum]